MTTTQQIRWTVLPAGTSADGTQALVSVFVSPRLTSDEGDTLGPFTDFLDWPAQLAKAAFDFVVEQDGQAVGNPIRPTGLTSSPDPALWQRFFHAQTPLVPHIFEDHSARQLASYPAGSVAQSVRTGFTGAAAAQTDTLPSAQTVAQMTGFAPHPAATGEAVESLTQSPADQPDQPPGPIDQFLAFHAPPAPKPAVEGLTADGTGSAPPAPSTPPKTPSDKDFHELLSALGDHPHLLRRLGLVLDFTLPADQITPSQGDFTMKVVPVWTAPSSDSQDISLSTQYVHSTTQPVFTAASGEGGLEDPLRPPARGIMPLDPEYVLEQIDVDGAALKAANAAAVAAADDGDGEAAPPTVRTKGLVIVHNDRAAKLQEAFTRAAALEDGVASDGAAVLTAEDLIRGYRLDVWDENRKRWLSLHERVVDYHAPGRNGKPIDTVTDEGFFQHGLAARADGDPDQLFAHEHLITWEGGGLSASPPGLVLSNTRAAFDPFGAGTEDCAPQRIDNTAQTALPLEIEVRVKPGSLPKLRFGHHYRVRVRTVDLAGNGPGVEQGETLSDRVGQVLPPAGAETFRRFEPVPAPVLVPRTRFTEGTSAYQLVIRSTRELPAADYATAFNASPLVTGGTHPPYAGTDERHLIPPKAPLRCVEWHGMLDEALPSADPAVRRATYELACRESGRLDEPDLPGVQFADVPGTPDDAQSPQQYPIHTGEQLEVPYLPDPYALGVILQDLPGLAEGDHLPDLTWGGPSWHQPLSLRLRIVEGSGAPQWDETGRVLTVQLPKAAVATIRVRSRIAVDQDILGMLQWCQDSLSSDDYAAVLAAANGDGHWMLTPWHEVTLVHAVQRPLAVPVLQFDDATPPREPGATAEHLRGAVTLDTASTERVDLFAQWSEWVDDPQQPGPQVAQFTAPVFGLSLAFAAQHGDDPDEPAASLAEDGLGFNTIAGEALTPPAPAKHEFHDTRHRTVSYHPVATTPFSGYFPPEYAQDPTQQLLSVSGEPVLHEVLSSNRPAPPAVLYGIPTLAFETVAGAPGTVTRRRRGGGLRIYLARRWYSSGDGELLGVVLAQGTTAPGAPDYLSVTLLGRDPVHTSAAVPATGTFGSAAQLVHDVPLTDVAPDYKVSVAGYQPVYDRTTRRWFCDVELDTGDAYLPFVRLALARYQPKAITGAELSPVVLTDLLRTLPERVLTVRGVQGTGPLTVGLTGPSYLPDDDGVGPRVTARLERRNPAIADEVLGWSPLTDEVELTRTDTGSTTADFSGEVPVPSRPEGERRRLLVVETERLPADSGPEGTTVDRIVYCDTAEI